MFKRFPLFYGWVIVGISITVMILVYGIRQSFSIFFPSILDEFGWSRGSTALMLSLSLLFYGLTAPFAGSLGDRWKPRWVVPIGITFLGLTTAGCAWASQLWHFYLLFGILMPIGMALSGWPIMAPTLANWFAKRRGLAMGLGQIGGGLSFTYGLFAEFVISQLGWRYAYLVLAGILVAALLPLFLFFFYYRPEDKGMKAFGATEISVRSELKQKPANPNHPAPHDWTLKNAMKTPQLWLLMTSNSLYWGMAFYMVLAHQVKFAQDVGYSSIFAASIFALFGVFAVIGQISAAISDWIGREKTVTLAVIISIAALAALVSVKDTSQSWLLYGYAICFGYGGGLYSPSLVAGAADIFYGRNFGAIAGLLVTGVGIGGAIGPWLGGYIYDISGSYLRAFILSMVFLGLSGIIFWMAAPRKAAELRARALR